MNSLNIQVYSSGRKQCDHETMGARMESMILRLGLAAQATRGKLLAPLERVIIDHNRKVMPCAILRFDIEEHRCAVIADLSLDDDLFAAFKFTCAGGMEKAALLPGPWLVRPR
jgi:hypothetical protein